MLKPLIALLTVFAFSCATVSPPQPAGGPTPPESKEPVFWSICYDEEGAVEDYDGNCEHPSEITWNLPIRVYIPADYKSGRTATLQAMSAWNGWLGTEVFRASTDPIWADVTMAFGGEAVYAAGMANHSRDLEGNVKFIVTMFDGYETSPEIVAHEFGHVLGLAHDPGYKRSLMYPGMANYLVWLTGKDCRALASKYSLKADICQK